MLAIQSKITRLTKELRKYYLYSEEKSQSHGINPERRMTELVDKVIQIVIVTISFVQEIRWKIKPDKYRHKR